MAAGQRSIQRCPAPARGPRLRAGPSPRQSPHLPAPSDRPADQPPSPRRRGQALPTPPTVGPHGALRSWFEGGGAMTDYHINVFWSDEDQSWVADVPDLAKCSALGDTPQEALQEV